MVRLHLIGFTTDLKNLIFATRRTAKRGNYIVEVDKRLLGALDEVAKLEAEAKGPGEAERQKTLPAQGLPPAAVRSSSLSPKEIQTMLREGKSEEQVAKLAETEVAWIRRFTGPIIAERAGVIDSVKAGSITKPRLGPSACNVGQAIEQNLSEKRIQMDPETYERSWKASRRGGLWQVVFQYSSRGKRKMARFSFDPETRTVTATNPVALEVGWRPDSSRKVRRTNGRRPSAARPKSRSVSTAAGDKRSGDAKSASKKGRGPAQNVGRSKNSQPARNSAARSSGSRASRAKARS